MVFFIGTQTLNNFQIFGKTQEKPVFALFDKTHTRCGACLLEEIFRNPLSEVEQINYCRDIICYLEEKKPVFLFGRMV